MKLGVIIGRFQVPSPHDGHKLLINTAIEQSDKVIVLIGSVNRSPSPRNPFSYQARKQAILKEYPNVQCFPLNDYMYNDSQWITDVVTTISKHKMPADKVTLFGHFKKGNDYLKWFPQYKNVNVQSNIQISGEVVRQQSVAYLPETVRDDIEYYKKEQALFSSYPFKETLNFNCADAVLECAGHILLIRRKFAPGRESWALPGGFKNSNETFLECALRELQEETNVRVPEKVLRGSIVNSKLFDNPNRSEGIPRNTFAVHIVIDVDANGELPRANGRSDASETRWLAINDILNNMHIYSDHGDIISIMTGTMPNIAINNY